MICKVCGKENPDDSKFCIYCGAKLVEEDVNETSEEKQEEVVEPQQEKKLDDVVNETADKVSSFVNVQKENLKKVNWKELLIVLKDPDSDHIFSKDLGWIVLAGSALVNILYWWAMLSSLMRGFYKAAMRAAGGFGYDFSYNSMNEIMKQVKSQLGINFFTYLMYGIFTTLAIYLAWLVIEKFAFKHNWMEASRIACTRLFIPTVFTACGIILGAFGLWLGGIAMGLATVYQLLALGKDLTHLKANGYAKMGYAVLMVVIYSVFGALVGVHFVSTLVSRAMMMM